MKAIILCAGPGTRMRPLTDTTPKCMLPVGGKPLLHHTLERLAAAGVTEVAINLHHLPKAIVHDLARGYRFGVRITYSFEKELLGTAGAIKRLAWWLNEEPFFVVYGDVWMTVDLGHLWRAHRRLFGPTATIVAHEVSEIGGRNALAWDADRHVTQIAPKTKEPDPRLNPYEGRRPVAAVHWACSGVYVLGAEVLPYIHPSAIAMDLEGALLPLLLSYGYPMHAYVVARDSIIDIGKPEGYARACALAEAS